MVINVLEVVGVRLVVEKMARGKMARWKTEYRQLTLPLESICCGGSSLGTRSVGNLRSDGATWLLLRFTADHQRASTTDSDSEKSSMSEPDPDSSDDWCPTGSTDSSRASSPDAPEIRGKK